MRNSLISSALLAFAAMALPLSSHATPAPDANSVLILEPTVTSGMSSDEALKATALGKTPVVVDAAQWSAMTTAEFKTYRAIVLGDPTCIVGTGPVSAALANREIWSPAVNGNIVLIGTDEVYHKSQGGLQLTESAVAFSSDVAGKTGLMVSLSCYYAGVSPGTTVPLLDQFGEFKVRGNFGCYNNAHIVATHPALAGTTDASLSGWGCSVHEAFDTFPPGFIPLAIARDITGEGSLTFADGSFGVPYILANGETITPINCGNGVVEGPEQCDAGANNGVPGSGCTVRCEIETVTNKAPDCSAAEADPALLWPPNHKMKMVTITGITDPDGDPLDMVINSITQDEDVSGLGSGDKGPFDAVINDDGTANIRAERQGTAPHNGRVYNLNVTATDPLGKSCSRTVQVCVPHDQSDPHECVDDGQLYNSTAP